MNVFHFYPSVHKCQDLEAELLVPRSMVAVFDYNPKESSPNADVEVSSNSHFLLLACFSHHLYPFYLLTLVTFDLTHTIFFPSDFVFCERFWKKKPWRQMLFICCTSSLHPVPRCFTTAVQIIKVLFGS